MPDQRGKRPLIVPIFIPFKGCPHRCVYCDQETIADQASRPVHPLQVTDLLEAAIRSAGFDSSRNPEVAFYGGTFTRLSRGKIQELLDAVAPFLGDGMFRSIRLSTRPDALDRETLLLLRSRGVETVELGAQSMDDEVLLRSQRGHTAGDTARSVRLLREQGLKVGIQLMPGLPGDSDERFLATVDRVIGLNPDMVRLYPTVVLEGTELAAWYRRGSYEPWSLDQALEVCSESVLRLEHHGIPVIRVGLMSSPSLRKAGQVLAGPWHEAFGHLVRSRVFHKRIASLLPEKGSMRGICIRVHPREVPLMRGFKNNGIREVEKKTEATVQRVVGDASLFPGCIRVESA